MTFDGCCSWGFGWVWEPHGIVVSWDLRLREVFRLGCWSAVESLMVIWLRGTLGLYFEDSLECEMGLFSVCIGGLCKIDLFSEDCTVTCDIYKGCRLLREVCWVCGLWGGWGFRRSGELRGCWSARGFVNPEVSRLLALGFNTSSFFCLGIDETRSLQVRENFSFWWAVCGRASCKTHCGYVRV